QPARLAERLLRSPADAAPASMRTAAAKAQQLGVSRDWVYRNAEALRAVRLPSSPEAAKVRKANGGKGAVGRLRFPADAALAAVLPSAGDSSELARPAPRRRRSTGAPGAVLRARPRLAPRA